MSLWLCFPGLKPVQYVDEGEPTSFDTDGNLITWLHNGSSIKEIAERDPYLVLALMFLSLKLAILIFPIMGARLQTLWASYAPHLSLGILGETSQLFGRAMHMIDVRRLWIKLRLAKTRNFQERAKNALASVSLGKSTSQSGWFRDPSSSPSLVRLLYFWSTCVNFGVPVSVCKSYFCLFVNIVFVSWIFLSVSFFVLLVLIAQRFGLIGARGGQLGRICERNVSSLWITLVHTCRSFTFLSFLRMFMIVEYLCLNLST